MLMRREEYTVLPARFNDSGEIIPGYPGQTGVVGWTSFIRGQLCYQHTGDPVFRSEQVAINHLWETRKFRVRMDFNPAEPRLD